MRNYADANELIERVLDGEEPEDVLDSVDEDIYIADLLSVEYLNPYLQEWQTIDEIPEDHLDEIEEWDFRECTLTEDDFLEKAGRLKKALKIGAAGAAIGGLAYGAAKGHKAITKAGGYKHVGKAGLAAGRGAAQAAGKRVAGAGKAASGAAKGAVGKAVGAFRKKKKA